MPRAARSLLRPTVSRGSPFYKIEILILTEWELDSGAAADGVEVGLGRVKAVDVFMCIMDFCVVYKNEVFVLLGLVVVCGMSRGYAMSATGNGRLVGSEPYFLFLGTCVYCKTGL